MNLLDVNVLIYAFRRDADRHEGFREWLLGLMDLEAAFAVSEQVLSGVLRITTHPKIFKEPTKLGDALDFVHSVRNHHNCRIVRPGENHWAIFTRLCSVTNAKANLITDAWFAAMALESGCTWITTDRDYSKFPSLRWRHPLDHKETVENPLQS